MCLIIHQVARRVGTYDSIKGALGMITKDTDKAQELTEEPKSKIKVHQSEWKTVGIRVRNAELPLLNRQLDRLNYDTLGDLVKDLMAGKITRITDDQQIDIMKTNLQTSGQITGLSGKLYDFYKQIDITELHKYLKDKYHEHTANCYLSYFERYANIFFGQDPDVELFKLKSPKRSWILQAIKRFGDFYFKKYNNREVIQLIKQIIERYDLNKDLDMKDRIYLVSPQFIEEKIKKIFEMPGEIGFAVRLGLLTGLREQELLYIKEKPVCNNGYGCDCEKLHVVNCKNSMSIIAIGWTRGNKKALATILPTKYWDKLRSLPKFDYYDIAAAHKIMKRDVGIAYIAMRKIHYNVMRFRETLAVDEAEVLAGRFKSVSGRYYVLHDPEKLTDKYITAWSNFDVKVTNLHIHN
jgi:intergrase/recombinase